jgi:TRAP-type C4-dicarboxylate transport system permease small subunit
MVKMLENTSDMLEFNNQKIADILLPNTILMLAGCALSIVGNITVMHIHWRKLNSADNFRKFIPYLALSDCIGSIVCSIISTVHNFFWLKWFNPTTCKVRWVLMRSVQSISISFLVVVAFQRFFRICRPFKTGIPKITKCVYAMVTVVFVIVQSVPFAYFADVISENTTDNITVFKCIRYNELDIDTRLLFGYKIVEMSLQASMVLIIIALYYKSAARLTQLANKVKSPFHSAAATILTTTTEMTEEISITLGRSLFYLQAESTTNDSIEDISAAATTNYGTTNRAYRKMKARNEKYKRINCMFILISIIVVLTYLPRIIISVFEMNNFDFWHEFLHDGNNANKELLIMVSIYRLYMISFFINPIVYSVMDLQFRKELRLCCCPCLES